MTLVIDFKFLTLDINVSVGVFGGHFAFNFVAITLYFDLLSFDQAVGAGDGGFVGVAVTIFFVFGFHSDGFAGLIFGGAFDFVIVISEIVAMIVSVIGGADASYAVGAGRCGQA